MRTVLCISRLFLCLCSQDWVVLGSVDLESLIEKHLSTVGDWERNFKALKARGRDCEKLPR